MFGEMLVGCLARFWPGVPWGSPEGCLGPLGPRIPGSQGPGSCLGPGIWVLGSLGPWVPGSLGPWVPGSLGPWVPGSLGPWVPGSLGLWVSWSPPLFPTYPIMGFIYECADQPSLLPCRGSKQSPIMYTIPQLPQYGSLTPQNLIMGFIYDPNSPMDPKMGFIYECADQPSSLPCRGSKQSSIM